MTRTVQSLNGASADYLQDSAERRKRLGQYFTGERLARLLVAIADVTQCRSALDPMCGSGDMLAAVNEAAPQTQLAGIEIDRAVYESCSARFSGVANKPHLIHGNSFCWSTISRLPDYNFDLVITNPPYVRYQSFAANDYAELEDIPHAEAIRSGLLEVAQHLPNLDDKDRDIFISVTKGYSGLSDLAVPSWILCAMLTAVGGRLAMVVPDAWLNRDYATPIHYLLLKLFRILWVIEDAHRVWFEDVQVKTTLLVAERIQRVDDLPAACAGQKYLHVALPADSITEQSIVGKIFPFANDPEVAFAKELSRLSADISGSNTPRLRITQRSLEGKLADLLAASRKALWLRSCEPGLTESVSSRTNSVNGGTKIPQALLDLLPTDKVAAFTTIEALGGRIGQGLRTGANDFFYCELIGEVGGECLVSPGKALKMPSVLLPKTALRPVLRKQSELPNGYVLVPSILKGRVLILDQFLHPNDAQAIKGDFGNSPAQEPGRIVMPAALAGLVDAGARTNLGTNDRPKLIPEMSAVRTNETKIKDAKTKSRYWYMLPPLARRHLPDLLVARVNHRHPRIIMNLEEKTVIDANFSTIWLEENAAIDTYALLAYLNSSWSVAAMELTAAVMGGGALKLEATHLRRLPVPALSAERWNELSGLGHQLASGTNTARTISEINRKVAGAIFGEDQVAQAVEQIDRINKDRLESRKKK